VNALRTSDRCSAEGFSFSMRRHACSHVDSCDVFSDHAMLTAALYKRPASSYFFINRKASPTVAVIQ
jgi:hypothetical protein